MSETMSGMGAARLSVVTPTFRRPTEVRGLLLNLSEQTLLPTEVILVDGAPEGERATEEIVANLSPSLPFPVQYLRNARGTAVQRNEGIDAATGNFIAFVDDDVRLQPDFFRTINDVMALDTQKKVGGIGGFRTNRHFNPQDHLRWRWYRRLKLLTTYEPGRYDFESGYPINVGLQAPFSGVRQVDFMTTACAMWRREVFDEGLRFSPFFSDYGVLEDAHFSLRAQRRWQVLLCGDAHCEEMHSTAGRVDRKHVGYKCVVNYYFVFKDIVRPLTWRHQWRFWRFQAFELFRVAASAARRRRVSDLKELRGRIEGIFAVARGAAFIAD